MDLEAATAELYRMVPSDFTAARDAKAAEARAKGDRELATAIKGLRRPTISAWLANWLVRERTAEVDRLLSLGTMMRQAQDDLDGDQLRQLSRQRHQVIVALTLEARRGGQDAGLTVSDPAVSELESTLQAALADEQIAELVRSGRLTSAVTYTGFGPAAPPTRPGPSPPERPRPASEGVVEAKSGGAQERERRQVADAERRRHIEQASQTLRSAEDAAREAVSRADELAEHVTAAQSRRDSLARSISELEQRLADLQGEAEKAAVELESAQASHADAVRQAETAHRAEVVARRRLEGLR